MKQSTTDTDKQTFPSFWREAFSENHIPSSKRIVGALALVAALGCTIYVTISGENPSVVENLIQTIVIAACSLLGLSSVTDIWKTDKHNNKDDE